MNPDVSFWRDRPVLLTGHTGFKGAWAAVWLARLGARVTGFALAPDTEPSLWRELPEGVLERELTGDLRNLDAVADAVRAARPSVVLHLAAQSLVRRSYADPVGTFATNVLGSVHLLEALRESDGLEAVLVVTTDKVYANAETGRDFVEDDMLGGEDPYSASKAAAELATASYASAFFGPRRVGVATARAGNVVGGGDWADDRLVPDVWRAVARGASVELRNPDATRPWQHVLEPLGGYFRYAELLAAGGPVPHALNFGPEPGDVATVATVAEIMASELGGSPAWHRADEPGPREMTLLSIDPTRARETIGWRPRLSCEEALRWSARWYAARDGGADARALCEADIERYEALPVVPSDRGGS